MVPDEDSVETIFDRIREHHGRRVEEQVQKLRWRFTTLESDFKDLIAIHEMDVPPATELGDQLRSQGYVFEFERRLHHYLSGLFSLVEQQKSLQDGVGENYRGELGEVRGDYLRLESSLTTLGLRHYIQHENVLPLQPKISKLDNSASLVIYVDDLHRSGEDRDFDTHFGHIDKPYFEPVELIQEDWPNVEEFFEDTIDTIETRTEEDRSELQQLREQADELYKRLAEDYHNWDNE
ncbi:hypothetical protein [Halobacterium yunchengense]|uniref:hypothetical protein n=1 Tax=Halobacterium yunchengense TaxID=3108497 RepID=UPI00300B7D90